jgi:lysozyme
MKTSENGLAKITGYEGKLRKLGDGRYISYRCPANVPTIYIGCTHGVYDGMIVTEEQGMAMFAAELEKKEAAVMRLVTVPLNQNEFDALVSFTYNCGEQALAGSTILKRLNKGDRAGAAKAFAPWNKATVNGRKVVLNGLVQRRASEANLFMKPVEAPAEPYMPQTVQKALEPPSAPAVATGTAATGGFIWTAWQYVGSKFNSFFDGLDQEQAMMLLGTAQKHGVGSAWINVLLCAAAGVGLYVLVGHVFPKLAGSKS